MPEMWLRMVRQGILIKKIKGELELLSFDRPCPTIMADGIGGICRRGWQYAVLNGQTLVPVGVVPKEGGQVDAEAELKAIRAYEAHMG